MPVESPTITPTRVDPAPNPDAWPDRFTDPTKICPEQRRTAASPDVEP